MLKGKTGSSSSVAAGMNSAAVGLRLEVGELDMLAVITATGNSSQRFPPLVCCLRIVLTSWVISLTDKWCGWLRLLASTPKCAKEG